MWTVKHHSRSETDKDAPPSWTFEIITMSFSAACLAALLGTLAYAEGQEVVSWHGVTLNTVVSLLATASKLAALSVLGSAIAQSKWNLLARRPISLLDFEAMELASQGPFGCIQLLWRTRQVAVLGALAFIASLGFDPFTQQLIQYRVDVIFANSSQVTVPRATRYNQGISYLIEDVMINNDTQIGLFSANADFIMQAAILEGYTQPLDVVQQQLQFTCPSANCTWDSFDSLSVCSTCNDVAPYLKYSTSVSAVLSSIVSPEETSTEAGNMTTFTLPNQAWIQSNDPYLRMSTLSTQHPSETITMKELDTLIWSITILNVTTAVVTDWGTPVAFTPGDLPVSATECALWYCVESYAFNITNNRIQSNPQDVVSAKRSPASWQPINNTNPDVTSQDDLTFNSLAFTDRTDLMLGDGFNISERAVDGIGMFMNQTLATSSGAMPNGITGFYMLTSNVPFGQPPIMMALHDSADLNATFQAVATSMSNALRTGADDKPVQTGQSGMLVTKYHVRWDWIVLPLAVLLASLAQLLISACTVRVAPLWKSSVLATLSRGRHIGDALEYSTVAEMHQAAKGCNVDLFDRFVTEPKARQHQRPWDDIARPEVHEHQALSLGGE